MMVRRLIHDDDGKILWEEQAPEGYAADPPFGLNALVVDESADASISWISEGEVAARPILPGFDKLAIAADDLDQATLALDVPFAARIDGQAFEVAEPDGEGNYVLALTSPMPAVYRVRVSLWPYRDYVAEVTAA